MLTSKRVNFHSQHQGKCIVLKQPFHRLGKINIKLSTPVACCLVAPWFNAHWGHGTSNGFLNSTMKLIHLGYDTDSITLHNSLATFHGTKSHMSGIILLYFQNSPDRSWGALRLYSVNFSTSSCRLSFSLNRKLFLWNETIVSLA